MYCSHCGKPLPDNAVYCPNCGTRTTVSSYYAPPAPTQPTSQPSAFRAYYRKPVTRRWWFWVLIICIFFCIIGSASNSSNLFSSHDTVDDQGFTATPNSTYQTSIQWALQENYMCAVEREDFDGDVIASGSYVASLSAAESPNGNQVPIVWDIYVSDHLYDSTAQLQQEEYICSIGGWDLTSGEVTVAPGQYLYVIYNDMAGEPIGIFNLTHQP